MNGACFVNACEFGKTMRDFYSRIGVIEDDIDKDTAYYVTGRNKMEKVTFDSNGQISIGTDYSFDYYHRCLNKLPKDDAFIPYVLYKGHRWYPQYHGIIHVYKDGREVE